MCPRIHAGQDSDAWVPACAGTTNTKVWTWRISKSIRHTGAGRYPGNWARTRGAAVAFWVPPSNCIGAASAQSVPLRMILLSVANDHQVRPGRVAQGLALQARATGSIAFESLRDRIRTVRAAPVDPPGGRAGSRSGVMRTFRVAYLRHALEPHPYSPCRSERSSWGPRRLSLRRASHVPSGLPSTRIGAASVQSVPLRLILLGAAPAPAPACFARSGSPALLPLNRGWGFA